MASTGRPTKYSPNILAKTRAYIASCVDEITEYHKTRGEKSDSFERLVRVKLPTLEGLSLHLHVHRDTIHAWSREYPIFSDALEELKALQAERLMTGALSGDYNPLIAKLILSANHGMKERTDVTTDDKELPAPIVSLDALRRNKRSQADSQPGEEG
jgi:hypothetical protein